MLGLNRNPAEFIRGEDQNDFINFLNAQTNFPLFATLVDGFPIAPMHVNRDEHIRHFDRILLIEPLGHGKTSLESILRPIWLLGQDANRRIKIVTSTDSKARDILFCINNLIERPSAELIAIFPNLQLDSKGAWNGKKLIVKRAKGVKDASIEAVGILSPPIDSRADYLIFDDILDFNNTILPGLQKLIHQNFFNVYLPLLEPGGHVTFITSVWTNNDLIAELEQKEKWKTLRQVIPTDFTPLWPQKWSREDLLQRYAEVGQQEFDRAYRAIPLPAKAGGLHARML